MVDLLNFRLIHVEVLLMYVSGREGGDVGVHREEPVMLLWYSCLNSVLLKIKKEAVSKVQILLWEFPK
jgi:hypothetical protein